MSNTKTILVTGSNGQLGQSIHALEELYLNYQFTFTSRNELDLGNLNSIKLYFEHNKYDIIINCAAYTAVDKAESDVETAHAINHQAVEKLAEIAKQHNTQLIHISTDYVFDGTKYKPYIETDKVNPQSVYGASKLKGEFAIQEIQPNAIIIRTSWVYSEFGQNFVKTMIRLGEERDQLSVIFDQIGSPTYAGSLATTIMQLLDNSQDLRGNSNNKVTLYHYSNEGVCSWYDFAKAIFEMRGITCQVAPITTEEYPTPAKRPHYSLLNKSKIIQQTGVTIPYWKEALQRCLKRMDRK